MKTISAALNEKQKEPTRVPAVKVEIMKRRAGTVRLDWELLYSGLETPTYGHDVVIAGDGSMTRLWLEDGANEHLFRQRIETPDENSDWSSGWIGVDTGGSVFATGSGVALAARGAKVAIFWVNGADYRTIYCIESTNYGATYGAKVTVRVGDPIDDDTRASNLSAEYNADGTVLTLFWSDYNTNPTRIWAYRRQAGIWEVNEHQFGTTLAGPGSCYGIGSLYGSAESRWYILIAGVTTDVAAIIYAATFTDAGAWTAALEHRRADAGSAITYRSPLMDWTDRIRYTIDEQTAADMPCLTYHNPYNSFTNNLWHEYIPLDVAVEAHGIGIAHDENHAWLSTPSRVLRATLHPATLDVSKDVISIKCQTFPDKPGKATLELDNSSKSYTDTDLLGQQIELNFGYQVGSTDEYCDPLTYWIESIEHIIRKGKQTVVLHAVDHWGLLNEWTSPGQLVFDGSLSFKSIFDFILAKAGFSRDVITWSAQFSNFFPVFAVHPTERGDTAIRRLLRMVPDVLVWRGDKAWVKNPLATESACYAYGITHAITEAIHEDKLWDANRAVVFGAVTRSKMDGSQVTKAYQRVKHVYDINIANAGQANDRADAMLREQEREAEAGEISVPLNPAQELFDVISVEGSLWAVGATNRRCIVLTHVFTPREGEYTLRLALGSR